MMVYGHQSSAADGAYFSQKPLVHDPHSYLATARRLPDDAAMSQPPPLLHQQPQLPQLMPTPQVLQQQQQQQQQQKNQQQMLLPPPLLKFQGVCDEGCSNSCDGNECSEDCEMATEDSSCCGGGGVCTENDNSAANKGGGGGGDSGFLYSLLTAQDAAAVQQCSAFLGGTADQFPRRSQSVSVPARRGSAVLPSATLQPFAAALGCRPPIAGPSRPSSAPRGLRGPFGGGSAPALTGAEEPLDLSGQQQQQHLRPESIIEQQLMLQQRELDLQRQHQHQLQQLQHLQQLQLQQQQQPMLRNMLLHSQMPHLSPQQPPEQQEQPVRLAKKTVLVAQSHVADWLKKGADLVRTNGALFGALDKSGRADLLCRAWPRILQLYMLEHNLQFAVSPAASASDDSGDETTTAKRQPTKSFADELQRLIAAASGLPFDQVTYNLLRLAAIFTPNPSEPDAPALAEVQSEILKHIYHHLGVKGLAQHFKEAEVLLEAVSLTDKDRLEILFCSHLSSTVDEYIRTQLG